MISRLRLSPSGPFITDSTSGAPLLVGTDGTNGTGSTGMVWRQQGGTASVDIAAGAAVLSSTSAFDGFAVPPGYHYELQGGFNLQTAGGATTVQFQSSVDDGATWQNIPGHLGGSATGHAVVLNTITPAAASVDAQLQIQVMDFDATTYVVTAGPGIRIRLFADGQATSVAGISWMRVVQFLG